METLASRLKRLRKSAGLSQPQLAEMSGVGSSTIAEIETGVTQNPTHDKLVKLAAHFEVNPEWLLTGKGPQHPVSSMKEDESELLLLYRSLTPEGRSYALRRVRDMHADEHRQRPRPPSPPNQDGDATPPPAPKSIN